ncbi:MAG: condensation domain-containing protein, partial [Acidobacteriota bacterium]
MLFRVQQVFQLDLPLGELFQSPTVAQLAQRVLSGANPLRPPIRPVHREEDLPLSFAQQRLWFLERLAPGNPFYNVPIALRLEGELDVSALNHSLAAIVCRHEVLRSCFPEQEGVPFQKIQPPAASFPLPRVDLQALPEELRDPEADRVAQAEALRPFDLTSGPVIRAVLVLAGSGRLGAGCRKKRDSGGWGRESEAEDNPSSTGFRSPLSALRPPSSCLLLTLHHLVFDGWSIGVLRSELAALYEAFLQHRPSPLPPLPIQYADFAVWQRGWLGGEVLEGLLSYWKERLRGAAMLELPTDRPRPEVQEFRGRQMGYELSSELSEELRTVSRRHGVTLYMTLLAAFQALMQRYSGQSDIVVGSPLANRNSPELEGLIGFFVNTLPMRADFSGDPSFAQLLEQVSRTVLESYDHQDLPFEKLVEHVQPERDLSRNPIFQVVFAVQNFPSATPQMAGLTVDQLPALAHTTRFDIEVHLWEGARGLEGFVAFDRELYQESTMSRLAGHYQTLLQGAAADPQQRISELPLMNQDEQDRLLEWSGRRKPLPEPCLIHRLFEEVAGDSPDSVALVRQEEQLSYAALNAHSNRLAHYLRSLGVGPDDCVGISMERSLELIESLGVVKAGGAYLPLDLAYPSQRVRFMFEDSGCRLLLRRGKPQRAQRGDAEGRGEDFSGEGLA